MNREGALESVSELLRRCYEIGRTPILAERKSRAIRRRRRKRERAMRVSLENPRASASFKLRGTLRPGADTSFSIDGDDFIVDVNTWVIGAVESGAEAEVCGVERPNGEKYATKIVILR